MPPVGVDPNYGRTWRRLDSKRTEGERNALREPPRATHEGHPGQDDPVVRRSVAAYMEMQSQGNNWDTYNAALFDRIQVMD